MPQAVAVVVADFVAAYLGDAIFAAVYYATEVAVTVAVTYAVNAAFAPKPPPLGSVDTPVKQPMPPRISGFGRTRMSGPYMLFEASNGVSSDVIALHDGQIDAYERYFLNDDEVEINGPGGGIWCPKDPRKYAYGTSPGDRVFINTTLGLATETAFSRPINDVPAFWDSSCRGDGIAALNLTCKQSKQKYQQEDFPNGVPLPSVVARLQLVFDPRAGQDQADPSTWAWSRNPILHLMAYLTTAPGGMRLDYSRRILPEMDAWKAAANDCDRAMALLGGGTEARYTAGGAYQHTTNPSDVITTLLMTFDGWLSARGNGALTVLSGVYVPPSVTFRDEHVVAYTAQFFQADEEAVNVLVPSFSDPDNLYNLVDAGEWRDEDDIAERGIERSDAMPLPWVQSPSQARRLAKRKMSRNVAQLRGSITYNLYGFKGLGERYHRLRLRENAALTDIVYEVSRVQMDLAGMTVTYDWVQADPDIDAWDRFTEEQPLNAATTRPDVDPLTAPTITDAVPFYETTGVDTQGARLTVSIAAPIEADVEWLVQWRAQGSDAWIPLGPYSDLDDGPAVEIETGFVPADVIVELQAAYQTAGGQSPWSATFSVPVPISTTTALQDETGDDLLDEAGLRLYEEA
jgi:hypothetical protein